MTTQPVVKFFEKDVTDVVDASSHGLCTYNSKVQCIPNTNVIVACNPDPSKVLLVCGGGSGHEPAHAGFVSRGWLSAAVCGSVYASPPTSHVSAAIEHLARVQGGKSGAGVLVIIKNYAGDVLNFEYAVRQARERGLRVETVLAADDVIFGTQENSRRRGVAGCCLLYKILGAAAAKGLNLSQLKALAQRVSGSNMRTIGASLSSCSLPGCPPTSVLPYGTVEIGLGIHGEKGLVQKPYAGTAALSKELVGILLGTADKAAKGEGVVATGTFAYPDVPPLAPHTKVVLLLNNLGGTTDMEMNVIAAGVIAEIENAHLTIVGVNVGRHMTALDMHGFSVTLLALEDEHDLEYVLHTKSVQQPLMEFHAPRGTQMMSPTSAGLQGPQTALEVAQHEMKTHGQTPQTTENSALRAAVTTLFAKLQTSEAHFNALDAAVGDGDLGSGVHRAAGAVLEMIPYLPWESDVARTFALISKACADACAGTSGPLYGALLLGGGSAAHRTLKEGKSAVEAVKAALAAASDAVQELGGAHKGDRTMVDVLEGLRESASVQAATTMPELMQACVVEGREAAEATAQLPAKFGRSRYMSGKEIGAPDPGAELVVFWVEVLSEMQPK